MFPVPITQLIPVFRTSHGFDDRYRLMLRRCLQGPNHAFGMIMPPRTTAPPDAAEYGTMLEIRSVQMLPDGRSMVETVGTYRFRVVEKGSLDGYMVAKIVRYVIVRVVSRARLTHNVSTAHVGSMISPTMRMIYWSKPWRFPNRGSHLSPPWRS